MLPPTEYAQLLRAAGPYHHISLTQAEIAMAVGAIQGQVDRTTRVLGPAVGKTLC